MLLPHQPHICSLPHVPHRSYSLPPAKPLFLLQLLGSSSLSQAGCCKERKLGVEGRAGEGATLLLIGVMGKTFLSCSSLPSPVSGQGYWFLRRREEFCLLCLLSEVAQIGCSSSADGEGGGWSIVVNIPQAGLKFTRAGAVSTMTDQCQPWPNLPDLKKRENWQHRVRVARICFSS